MTTRRWNPNTRAWDLDRPAHRDYPPLSASLEAQLRAIEPTHDGIMEYFPCLVVLETGEQRDHVFIAPAESYIRVWGIWPDDDPGKKEIRIQDVTEIRPSPSRLPAELAHEMYAVGESGMGFCIFTLQFVDGTLQSYCTGNLIDFPELPPGQTIRDVVAIRPSEGRGEKSLGSRDYHWCLFSGQPQPNFVERLKRRLRLRL